MDVGIVGGSKRLTEQGTITKIRELGATVVWHCAAEEKPNFSKADIILCMVDHCGHPLYQAAKNHARDTGAKFSTITTKWSQTEPVVRRMLGMPTTVPVEVRGAADAALSADSNDAAAAGLNFSRSQWVVLNSLLPREKELRHKTLHELHGASGNLFGDQLFHYIVTELTPKRRPQRKSPAILARPVAPDVDNVEAALQWSSEVRSSLEEIKKVPEHVPVLPVPEQHTEAPTVPRTRADALLLQVQDNHSGFWLDTTFTFGTLDDAQSAIELDMASRPLDRIYRVIQTVATYRAKVVVQVERVDC